jgi:hypothetical protein
MRQSVPPASDVHIIQSERNHPIEESVLLPKRALINPASSAMQYGERKYLGLMITRIRSARLIDFMNAEIRPP